MAKGEFGMLYLCAGGGGGYDIFLWKINISRGGVRKKTLRWSGGLQKNERKKYNKEIITAHPLDKLWMLPKDYKTSYVRIRITFP